MTDARFDGAAGKLIQAYTSGPVKWSRSNVMKTADLIEPIPAWRWRMIDLQIPSRKHSVWQWIYGTDIFLNGWPVLKIFAGLVLLGAWVISTL